MADVTKLRVLCLHGYRQDATAFKSKLGGFRKATKSLLDLVFIDAPHVIENGVYSEADNEGGRAWWFSSEKTFSSKEYTDTCRGFEESVKAIEEAFKEQGPFDGILGFSQGAAMTAMILSLQSLKRLQCSFKFGVLVAGFRSRSSAHDYLFTQEGTIDVPTLHIVGETDNIIPKAQATEILPFFVSPSVLYHLGGHFLPTSSDCKAEYITFFKKMASVHNALVSASSQAPAHGKKQRQGRRHWCQFCGYETNHFSNMKAHIRTHTGDMPYKCHLCPLSFSRNDTLGDHLRTHTGERPYKCHLCPNSFSVRSSLKHHLRVHSGETPYQCPSCPRLFRHTGNLNRHLRQHDPL